MSDLQNAMADLHRAESRLDLYLLFFGLTIFLVPIVVHVMLRLSRHRKSRVPVTPERERLDRLEKLNRAVTAALYSTREARIYTSDDLSDLDAVRAMRERLGFASDSLVSAQREVTEWLRVAVAEERADA